MSLRNQLLVRRFYQRLAEQMQRRGPGILAQWEVNLKHSPMFHNYWPELPATVPEMLVFMELVRRGVNFKFQWYLGDIGLTPFYRERIRPDFILVDYNIILEPNGLYWHTRPGSFGSDVARAALLTGIGYSVRIVTDADVMRDVVSALDLAVPEIRTTPNNVSRVQVGRGRPDYTAALRSRLQKGPRRIPIKYPGSRITSGGAYKVPEPPKPPPVTPDPIFLGFPADLEQYYLELGRSIRDFIKTFGTQEELDAFIGY